MKSTEFEKDKRDLEKGGYEHNGAYIACPAVGGDHDLELWVHPKKEEPVEVCQICQTVSPR